MPAGVCGPQSSSPLRSGGWWRPPRLPGRCSNVRAPWRACKDSLLGSDPIISFLTSTLGNSETSRLRPPLRNALLQLTSVSLQEEQRSPRFRGWLLLLTPTRGRDLKGTPSAPYNPMLWGVTCSSEFKKQMRNNYQFVFLIKVQHLNVLSHILP